MIIFENLKIMYRDSVVFDMYLKSDRVVVHGNSATGKSFFCKTLLLLQRNKGVYPELPKGFTDINDLQKIEVFSAENMKKEKLLKVLKEIRYKLIIIDNADILINDEI